VLHDIGKALTHEVEGSHALIGAEIARRYGEPDDVVHAIEAHHNEVEVADRGGGADPGGRRDQRGPSRALAANRWSPTSSRLERLEQIALRARGRREGLRDAGRPGDPGHGQARDSVDDIQLLR
jgi:ribonuclease Y